jgi:hypothetical protein
VKPIKGLDDEPSSKNALAGALVAGVTKVIEYAMSAVVYLAVSAVVAWVLMMGLAMMHSQEPATPTFGFLFLWPVVWSSGIVVTFVGNLIKISTQEE